MPCLEMQLSAVPKLLDLLAALGPNLLVVLEHVEAILWPGPPQSLAKGCIASCLLQYLRHTCQLNYRQPPDKSSSLRIFAMTII